MKRKVAKVGQLRLSPNEETMLLKEEYERRRKLRLQQVREQQKYIALQIRQKVKQRREEQLHQLEEALRAEWQKAQDEKMKALEEFYLSSLRAIGEGHRQAKENEPDLEALAKQAEERRQRAEKRHRKALKEQKYQKENLLREQARRTNARKHALEVERQRAAKIASLPPPPRHPLENFEVKKAPAVKPYSADNFSVTRYHISEPYVDREVDGEQPDARSAAEEEGKRLEELHRETERERREQLEKAHVRGSHALKKVHLAQDRERLLKELEQMQNMDRMRRRRIVAQMPPQLFVPPYKRMEIKEEWQRELEFAFEDMCSEDRKMKEDLILQFEPQPLPAPDRSQDNDLDISLEQESACGIQPESACNTQPEEEVPIESEDHEEAKTRQLQSKLALKKLLKKIRSQKEEWTSKSEKDTQSEVETIESGTIASEERPVCDSELNYEQQKNIVCEARDSVKTLDKTVAAENSVLIHPQEQAAKIRMQERQKWNEQIEKQKQEQLALLQQIEEERARLEADLLKIQIQSCLETAKKKKDEEEQGQLVQSHSVPSPEQQNKVEHEAGNSTMSEPRSPGEDSHLQMIHNYQQRLLQQNRKICGFVLFRLHRQTIEEGRKHLQEYQNKLKQKHLSAAALPSSVDTKSIHLKPVLEARLQRQGVQPTQCQSPEQVHAQEHARLLPAFSGPLCMSENSSSQQHEEQMHNICPGRHMQFSEALKLKHGEFHLPCGHPSQEGVGMLETSSCHVREPPWFPSPSGVVMKDVAAVRTQPEARVQHVRFMLPAEDSSEPSEVVRSRESSHQQTETKAREESHVIQAAPVDSLAYQQGYAESTIRTSLEEPLSLSEPVTLSHEKPKAQGVGEFLVSKTGDESLLNYCGILNLRDRVLASSESIQAQQKYLKELQEQLDAQREALLSRQKIQEQLLLQKQDKLKEQMQRQQEALKELLNKQVRHSHASEEMTEAQKPDWIDRTDFFQVLESYQQESCGRSKFHGSEMISQYMGPAERTEQTEKVLFKEQKWRSSKPPVAKVKLGLGLEPHELSIIPEVDTPKSCSISFADKTDSVGGESSLISTTGEFSYVKHYSHKEGRKLPSSITNSEEQISSGSPRPSRLLQEVLLVTAESSHDSDQSQDSQVAQDSPVLAAEVGEGATAQSGPSFRLDNMEALSKVGSTDLGSEALMQEIPCDLSSTISTGSFLTSEVLDVNPVDSGLSSDSTEDGVLRETARCPWKPSLPFTLRHRQENLSGASETQLPEGEMYPYRENQILEKSTGDLSSYLEDNTRFQALTAELDFAEMERPLPNFHHQFFQPLEPSLDFDTSSSCSQHRISQDSREFSKTSKFSTQSKDASTSLEVGNSNLTIQRSSLPSSLATNRPNNGTPEEQSVEGNLTPGSEESFHPLPLESTLSGHCRNTNQLGDVSAVLQGCSDQTPGMRKQGNEKCISPAREYKELARNMESIDLQCSMEDLQNESLNPLEEQEFYPLNTTPGTVDDTSPQHLLKETMSSEKSPVEILEKKFVKLPERSVHLHEANKAVELDSQCNRHTKEPDQSFPDEQKSFRIPRETNLEDSDLRFQAVVQQSGSVLERHEKHSRPVPRSSCSIPVWETESGCGIMEEPELTLISSNDISIAESDIEHSNQGKIKEDKISSPAAVDQSEFHAFTEEREFLPLVPDADYSVFARPDSSSKARSPNDCHLPSPQTAVMVLEFAAAPGSLQESFLKQKQNFIQKSLKRVEGIKTKERANEKPEARRSHRGKSEKLSRQKESSPISGKKGAVASQLKKVGEVSSPGDRNSGETGMRQRTSRLYNQLAEVKMRKEEKTRQETYAKNREKAKEFQKKMLEKLRAKKTGKAP
ncbi:centrosomal protein of 295 kDa isoform X1 [Pezoporus flaviventris]|uniref:centrosomal protein of 295 kDa isoform X1 n=1 Tax=Pezoporus flaviventris TaxID=889875 RepID=UPI002AB25623|nr:centrosomal protein of 295 kDa isoform X1 [Pezoporus flaviventris]